MKERRHQLAGTMSGGEQQMCAIGRALMCDPKLLLLDEPSAGLAPVVVQQVFELVRRIRGERAHGADRRAERAAGAARGRPRLSAGGRHHPRLRHARPRCWRATRSSRRISVCRAGNGQSFLEIFDIYLLEAVINGILLGGVLALLALGLNLIFGVIDVTWICYAELIMIGMYGMYYLVRVYHVPYWVAAPICILLVAGAGRAAAFPGDRAAALRRRRSTSCWPPAACCSSCRASPRSPSASTSAIIGIRLPVLRFGEMNFSYARLLAFVAAAGRHGRGLRLHEADLCRHRHPRHRPGPPDHGADGRRHAPHLPRSPRRWAARWPASPPACWCCCTTCIPSSACRSGRSPS